MKRLHLATAALAVTVAACGYNESYNNETAYNEGAAYNEGGANYSAEGTSGGSSTATATNEWPEGTRIVVENGVTYRIDPGGTRIELGPNDSRIVVDNGVRYRVDPSGTRVRINENGVAIDLNPAPGVSATVNTD